MNSLKKMLALSIVLFAIPLFAEPVLKWYICTGSFRERPNAVQRVLLLRQNNIDSFLSPYQKANGELLYRVVINAPFETSQEGMTAIAQVKQSPQFASLGITGLWCCQAYGPVTNAEPQNIKDGRFILIMDSDSGNPIPQADVNIDKRWDVVSSDEGKAPLPDEVTDGEHDIIVSKGDEYVATESHITISDNVITSVPQVALPKVVDYKRIKIILEWGEYPYDLDSHVIKGTHHVYFANRDESNLNLDRDDITSYGPETTTIRDPLPTDTYQYYVFDFTNNASYYWYKDLSNSQATVKVYNGNTFIKKFTITPNQEGVLWHVFDIVNGQLVPVDKVEKKALLSSSYTGNFELTLGY